MRFRLPALAVVTALAITGLTTGTAVAKNNKTKLTGGATTLAVPAETATALTTAGFTLAPVAPATAAGTTFSFPITKGQLTQRKARGFWRGWFAGRFGAFARQKAFIKHDGGLTIAKGTTTVTLSKLRIWVRGKRGVLEAKVNGRGRAPIANLTDVTVANGKGTANATLTNYAARGLNRAFGVTTFTKGAALGVVTVTPTTA